MSLIIDVFVCGKKRRRGRQSIVSDYKYLFHELHTNHFLQSHTMMQTVCAYDGRERVRTRTRVHVNPV